jgi:hypothetical protein
VSTFSRPASSRMRPNSLPRFPNCGESLIPLVVLTVTPEYDSTSWILTGESRRREGHKAFSPHLCNVGQSWNGESEQRYERQEGIVAPSRNTSAAISRSLIVAQQETRQVAAFG